MADEKLRDRLAPGYVGFGPPPGLWTTSWPGPRRRNRLQHLRGWGQDPPRFAVAVGAGLLPAAFVPGR